MLLDAGQDEARDDQVTSRGEKEVVGFDVTVDVAEPVDE